MTNADVHATQGTDGLTAVREVPAARPLATGPAVIETHELTKRYGDRLAVDRLNLTIHQGEIFGFLGPNGAGKTTTLRMLLGLIRPTSGSATVLGQPPGTPSTLGRLGVLVDNSFYPYLSGRDNLRVMAQYDYVPSQRIDEALATVDLSDRAGDKYKSYSMGMKQRLGVAAALLKEPTLLILDEPTNGLDPEGMADMRSLIRNLGRGDRTVLLSSHLLNEVQQVCDRVGIIQNGKLLTIGGVAQLRGEPSLLIRAAPLDRAQQIVATLPGVSGIEANDGALTIMTDPQNASLINERLVTAGVSVSELRPMERSLEEVYMELTHRTGASPEGEVQDDR
jgi:ABC-2 type transport system ATP-binding protein